MGVADSGEAGHHRGGISVLNGGDNGHRMATLSHSLPSTAYMLLVLCRGGGLVFEVVAVLMWWR